MKNKVMNIASRLRWKILSGIYKPTTKLPSEHALAIKENCSRLTARKALQILKQENLIVSYRGRGYFVSMGQEKLIYQPKHGDAGEKIKFHIINERLSDGQLEIFKDMDPKLIKQLKSFKFSFMKTNFNKTNVPYSVLHSFLNTEFIGSIDANELRDSLSAFLLSKNIFIKKRVEKIVVIKPPHSICLKLKILSSDYVAASYSIMYTDDQIVEIAIRYTKADEFSSTFVKDY